MVGSIGDLATPRAGLASRCGVGAFTSGVGMHGRRGHVPRRTGAKPRNYGSGLLDLHFWNSISVVSTIM